MFATSDFANQFPSKCLHLPISNNSCFRCKSVPFYWEHFYQLPGSFMWTLAYFTSLVVKSSQSCYLSGSEDDVGTLSSRRYILGENYIMWLPGIFKSVIFCFNARKIICVIKPNCVKEILCNILWKALS